MTKKIYYGGQAVIEGVMMRGRKSVVTAVRRPDGDVVVDTQKLPSFSTSRARQIPVIRGVIVLIESLILGLKSLMYSANVSLEEEEEQISGPAAWGMVAGSIAFVVAIFFLAPLFLTRMVAAYFESSLLFHLVEGFIRLGIFIAYLKILNMSASLRKVFSYHGAEHKTINAYEAGMPLEVDAIREYGKAHTRCGTGFMFVVLLIAIFVFAFVGRPSLGMMVVWRIILIPVIAGIGYEATQFGARHTNSRVVRAFLAPGMWLQSLTTREPDDSQIEVAATALKKAIEIDNLTGAEMLPPDN